jgi:2-haloalkanoic acid dehalogenase, type II
VGCDVGFDPDQVSTVTFDSYSTLVDVDSAEKALAERVTDPEPVSRRWRARSLEYTFVANAIDAYQPFYEMNRDALQHALDVSGADISTAERDEILAVYHELDVFDDVRDGITRLREGGYDCYVASNGNPAMLDSMVDHAEIGDLLVDTISADEIQTYKPAAELYQHAATRTDTPIEEIVHVTAGWFDVMGAHHAGMQTAWVDRKSTPWEPFGPSPDLTVETFHQLADQLGI